MIKNFRLLRNVGQFDSVSTGENLPLSRLTLIYAENGRGKTTLTAILRSLGSNDPEPILARRRLGATEPPHVIVTDGSQPFLQFENEAWNRSLPEIAIFDDVFVDENVHTGLAVDTENRKNLHELILGAEGVTLNSTHQNFVTAIAIHNSELRTKAQEIPENIRGGLTLDAFCTLKLHTEIEKEIIAGERVLAAA